VKKRRKLSAAHKRKLREAMAARNAAGGTIGATGNAGSNFRTTQVDSWLDQAERLTDTQLNDHITRYNNRLQTLRLIQQGRGSGQRTMSAGGGIHNS
jgi:hypothetical protein